MNIVANLITSNSEISETEEKPNLINSSIETCKNNINKDFGQFDAQFVQIIIYLREIHQLKNPNEEFTLNYLFKLFDRDIPVQNESLLIKQINKIGFINLRDTFERINMECEDYFCESENLFGIFKRHQFKKRILETDSDKLRQVIQYLHITLIHVNILHKKCISLPANLIGVKRSAYNTIEPFVNEVESSLRDLLHNAK